MRRPHARNARGMNQEKRKLDLWELVMERNRALVIVDMQKDFCPGGELPVRECDETVRMLNGYIDLFSKDERCTIFASRDWHPPRTGHFEKYGGKWPKHCVQGTEGAEFHEALSLPADAVILSKGMDPLRDSYSVFQARDPDGKSFSSLLLSSGITDLYIGGVATDYCVRHTVLDALDSGYRVMLLEDAIQGVDEENSRQAVEEMRSAGAGLVTLRDLSHEEHEGRRARK